MTQPPLRHLDEALTDALQEAVRTWAASAGAEESLPASTAAVRWDIPKEASLGDLSSPIAFTLASARRQPPPAVAEEIIAQLRAVLAARRLAGVVERLDVVRGFINLFLSQQALSGVVRRIHRERHQYGRGQAGAGKSVLIEFVSANPTGPLSVAHGRQAAEGDALARLLRFQGYRVTAEYYLNDEGRQIELLGKSLRARCAEQLGQAELFPEDGYHGAYVTDSAKALVAQCGPAVLQKPLEWFAEQGMKEQLHRIQEDLRHFGLQFDRWTSQRWLRTSGKIDRALDALRSRGLLFEQDGATWFASTKFGDDKDRVVKKQSGELTYVAPDIAYHAWKFEQGYGLMVNLWGPDHHGYIPRVKAAMTALGQPADRLVVRIVQLVTLSRDGAPVPMSKRQGEFITFREILDEVGVDATRFFYLIRTMDSHLDFDLELAKSKAQENPVYYVQYAHARICSILAYAQGQLPWFRRLGRVDLARLSEPEERRLLRHLCHFPVAVRVCAQQLEPHGMTAYLQKLAELFHVFYTRQRVITEDVPRSRARLKLISAARWVLANGLELLGISAPRRM